MGGLRLRLTGLVFWLAVLYNIERLGQPVNIASFVYVIVALSAGVIVLTPLPRQLRVHWLLLAVLLAYLVLKPLLGYPVLGEALPLTVLEISSLSITVLFARQIARDLDDLGAELARLAIGPLTHAAKAFETSQGQMYREIRRARRFHRPLTVLTIAPTVSTIQQQRDRFREEMQRLAAKKYIGARLANFLLHELKDSDTVAQRGDHFVVLMPETTRENGAKAAARLAKGAWEQLGLEFAVGLAAFPSEAATLETMLEVAEADMQRAQSGQHPAAEMAPARPAEPPATSGSIAGAQAERSGQGSSKGVSAA